MRKKNNTAEYDVHCQVVDWLVLTYPDVMFRSDYGGINLTIGHAKKLLRLQRGRRAWPDLFIAEPAGNLAYNKLEYGLFIEIKTNWDKVYRKNGELRRSKHIMEQSAVLEELRKRQYRAEFGCGFAGCQNIIQNYLGRR